LENKNIGRQLFHFTGIIIPVTYYFGDKKAAILLTGVLLIISMVLELLRIRGFLTHPLIQKYIKHTEIQKPTGSFFFILSSLLTILIFERYPAMAALFVLSISDPLASIIGRYVGKKPFFGKSIEGSVAFFISSLAILLFWFSIPVASATACIATFTELVSSRFFDDNIAIPVLAPV